MTELIWDGKYKDGKKQGPVRIALPFQTIETVNEGTEARYHALELFAAGRETAWRNRLIWGDKKYVLPSLLPEFAGKVNLIYIDPPFDTGADFSFTATIPDHPDADEGEGSTFTKEPSILEQKAYRDTWGVSTEDRQRGVSHVDRYVKWFYETVVLLRELLAEDGSIYVHCDWRVNSYIRLALDEVFGPGNHRNEIIWAYQGSWVEPKTYFPRRHNSIFFYKKNDTSFFNRSHEDDFEEQVNFIRWRDYIVDQKICAKNMPAHDLRFKPYIDHFEKAYGRYPNGEDVVFEAKGSVVGSVWNLKTVDPKSPENVNYPTQKAEALLERIIKASSNEGDLVLDCFVGSGTAAAVAEKLNRRWIACDLGRFAIHTTRKRLLGIPNVRPFVVQNLGKYERQAWQAAEFSGCSAGVPTGDANAAMRTSPLQREMAYRKFILDLYHATPITGRTWLHGAKGGRMVHVGAVDAPVTLADVKAIAKEVWRGAGTGKDTPPRASVDILGWEFAFELNETAKQVAAESRVEVAFKKIPHEALDKKAVEQGDIKFFELGALSVDVKQKKKEATLKLTNFIIPIDDIPEEVRKAIKHWSQMVDYWAVDWDYRDDTFHNQWQSYRTRKDPKIELETTHSYPEAGKYTIVVKVIDILGNDTTKTIQVEVR